MTDQNSLRSLSRRELLRRAVAGGTLVVSGAGFVAAPDVAWAVEVTTISGHEMATLIQMARDIYPHDRIGDMYYAIAVRGYDSPEHQELVSTGVAELDGLAGSRGAANYLATRWEDNRVALLQRIEGGAFFQTVRGGLVTGLYDQKAVWPVFGYEGESFSKGGYLERGFNDINWL